MGNGCCSQFQEGVTALLLATDEQDADMAAILLDRGALVNCQDAVRAVYYICIELQLGLITLTYLLVIYYTCKLKN